MLEAFVITLREGVEAALIVAILLAYLKKTGRTSLSPYVYAGVSLALVASVAGALALSRLAWNAEAFEGFLMLAGAACVITLVIWMNRAAHGLRREIESHADRAMSRERGPALALFVLTAVMILREGVETILFLMATSFTTSGLAQVVGAFFGLGLALVFAVLLLRGTMRVDLGRFFRITTIVLFVLAFQLVVGGLHELSESGILPSSRAEMAIVGPLVRHETFIFLVVLLLAIALIGLGRGRTEAAASAAATAASASAPEPGPASAPEPGDRGAAERRKLVAGERRERGIQRAGLGVGLVVVAALTLGVFRQRGAPDKLPGTAVEDVGGQVRVPRAGIESGGIHFFELADPERAGERLRFFAINTPNGLRVCMDACEICGDQGYYEDGGSVTCRNCSAPINLATLGQSGGCNPIPVSARLEGTDLVVDAASIYAQRSLVKGKS